MLKHTIAFAVVAELVFAASPAAQADIVTDPGVEEYRLAFVTTTTTTATSADIDYYNDFVSAAAASVPELAALGVTWKCIGSTGTTNAKENTNTLLPGDPGYDSAYDVPIYNLAGDLISASNAQLWDGGIDNLFTHDNGTPVPDNDTYLYTGTRTDGTADYYEGPQWPDCYLWLGSEPDDTHPEAWVTLGASGHTNGPWITANSDYHTLQKHLYAMSDPISAVVDVPGDTNGDGVVNDADLANLEAQFGGPPGGVNSADFDDDVDVDLHDFAIIRGNWQFGVGGGPLPAAATPEPATLILMAAGLPVLLKLRRRRS